MEIEGRTLRFVANADAEPALQRFSEAFWRIAGYDELRGIEWALTTAELPHAPRFDSRDYVLAALGGGLEIDDVACPTCGTHPYQPTGRSNVLTVTDVKCRACSPTLTAAIAKASSPQAQRRARQGEAARRHAAEEAAEQASLSARRQQLVRSRFRLADEETPTLDLEQAVAVLAAASIAARGIIGPVDYEALAPSGPAPDTAALLASLVHDGVLRIDPESAPDAFVWTEDDPANVTSWRAPSFVFAGAGTAPQRFADATDAARRRLERLDAHDDADIVELLTRAAIGETARYLDLQLTERSLDRLTAAHVTTLTDLVRSRGTVLPLGRLYNIAYGAVRAAVDSRARHPMRKSAAVNAFARRLDTALTDGHHADVFDELDHLPLTPWTSVVFRILAKAAPMSTPIDDAAAAVRARLRPPTCAPIAGWRERLHAVLASDVHLDLAVARRSVERVRDRTAQPAPCDGACTAHEWVDFVAGRALLVDDTLAAANVDERVRVAALLRTLDVGGASADMGAAFVYVLDALEDAEA